MLNRDADDVTGNETLLMRAIVGMFMKIYLLLESRNWLGARQFGSLRGCTAVCMGALGAIRKIKKKLIILSRLTTLINLFQQFKLF